jgi:hypothetical protein
MTSGLTTARTELAAALESATDFRVAAEPTGNFSAPCYRLHPGSPWLGPSDLAGGRRTQRWEIWVVAGKLDSKASVKQIEEMISAANAALDALHGSGNWGLVEWERPGPVDMGATYYACRGTIETIREA